MNNTLRGFRYERRTDSTVDRGRVVSRVEPAWYLVTRGSSRALRLVHLEHMLDWTFYRDGEATP